MVPDARRMWRDNACVPAETCIVHTGERTLQWLIQYESREIYQTYRVLEVPVPSVLVLGGEHGYGLEASPANREHKRIWCVDRKQLGLDNITINHKIGRLTIALQDLLVPSMLLEPTANEASFRFLRCQASNHKRHDWIE